RAQPRHWACWTRAYEALPSGVLGHEADRHHSGAAGVRLACAGAGPADLSCDAPVASPGAMAHRLTTRGRGLARGRAAAVVIHGVSGCLGERHRHLRAVRSAVPAPAAPDRLSRESAGGVAGRGPG